MWYLFAQLNQPEVQTQLDTATKQQDELLSMISSLQSLLFTLLPFLVGFGILIAILLMFGAIYKMRVDRAILRIDKNLQKLVDMKIPNVESEEGSPKPENATD